MVHSSSNIVVITLLRSFVTPSISQGQAQKQCFFSKHKTERFSFPPQISRVDESFEFEVQISYSYLKPKK